MITSTRPLRSPFPWLILIAWVILIVWLASLGVFIAPEQSPPVALLIAAMTPALLFAGVYRFSSQLQNWVEALDLAFITATQAWRVIGVTFLFVWGLGSLPPIFAATAGFGDLAVGIAAAFIAVNVVRRSSGWRTQSYILIFAGMLDFVGAFGTAILSNTGRLLAIPGTPTPDLMQKLPMVIIPAFGVPLFIILHLIAWLKLRSEHEQRLVNRRF